MLLLLLNQGLEWSVDFFYDLHDCGPFFKRPQGMWAHLGALHLYGPIKHPIFVNVTGSHQCYTHSNSLGPLDSNAKNHISWHLVKLLNLCAIDQGLELNGPKFSAVSDVIHCIYRWLAALTVGGKGRFQSPIFLWTLFGSTRLFFCFFFGKMVVHGFSMDSEGALFGSAWLVKELQRGCHILQSPTLEEGKPTITGRKYLTVGDQPTTLLSSFIHFLDWWVFAQSHAIKLTGPTVDGQDF